MARSWLFSPAEFRGVPFYVESQTQPGGRRLVTHEYPSSEDHDVEDMGRKAVRFTITAYVVGEVTDSAAAALIKALDKTGPGLLVTPMFGAKQAWADTWSPEWNKDKPNYVGLSITFVEDGKSGNPSAAGATDRQIADNLTSFTNSLAAAVSTKFSNQSAATYAAADAAASLVTVGTYVTTTATMLAGDDTVTRATVANVASIEASVAAGSFAAVALPGPTDQVLPPARSILYADAGPVLAQLLGQLHAVSQAATGASTPTVLSGATLTAVSDAAAAQASLMVTVQGASVLACAALMLAGETLYALATADYAARQDAILARTKIQTLALAAAALYGGLGPDVVSGFNQIWGQAADLISRKIVTLAPIILISSPVSLPSSLLAYRLYKDPERGVELVRRNHVKTPTMMPTLFEAAAS